MGMSTDDMVFTFCSNVVFVPWLALMFAPKWKWTSPITRMVVLISCIIYTFYFGKHMMNTRDGVVTIFTDMGTLTGLSKLFRDEGMVLPAWVHYLAFDLLAGHYCVQKNMADVSPLSKPAMVPILFLHMMAGPMGTLLYVCVRALPDLMDGNFSKAADKATEKIS
ncbi:unnamed protein product [Pylaiella littoralis]